MSEWDVLELVVNLSGSWRCTEVAFADMLLAGTGFVDRNLLQTLVEDCCSTKCFERACRRGVHHRRNNLATNLLAFL